MAHFKRPESVLVVVYSRNGSVLLLKRADQPDFWQSVTGSMDWGERDPRETAVRELKEETGLNVAPQALRDLGLMQHFPIVPPWRDRYAADVVENVEYAFVLELEREIVPTLAPREHTEHGWFPFEEARRKVASWSNRNAIRAVQQLRGVNVEMDIPVPRREAVVLVHGVWMRGWCMALLAWRLRRAGFDTFCLSYHSVRSGLRDNAVRLQAVLSAVPHATVHLVGHSLGNIVIRALFHYFPDQRPGRIVMLAPPNVGSMAAEQLSHRRFGRFLIGKSLRELISGVPGNWSVPARDIGVVSGTSPVGLGRFFAVLPPPHDGVVTQDETALPCPYVALSAPASHTGMILSARVALAVARFLSSGVFQEPAVGQGPGR